jgi:pseudaminic acid cytidylyltransferase
VVVSTDDPEIAAVARACGASTPFLRPNELSDDYTPTVPVVRHAIEWFAANGQPPDLVCCIYATAPFVTAADLQRGLTVLETSGAEFAFSVTSFAFPIQRAIRITEAGRVQMFQPEHFATRSQDLEEALHDAGQFYWGKVQAWLSPIMLFSEASATVRLPRQRVQDIDTLEDWQMAELLMKAQQPAQG